MKTSVADIAPSLALAAALALFAGTAKAEPALDCDVSDRPAETAPVALPPETKSGLVFQVLLPSGYDPQRRPGYPVLFVIDGDGAGSADACRERRDLIEWSRGVLGDAEEIVVAVDAGDPRAESDFHHGPPWETAHVRALIPYIDSKYDTLKRRRYRIGPSKVSGSFVALEIPNAE